MEKVLRLNCKTMEVEEIQLKDIVNLDQLEKVHVNSLFQLSRIDIFVDKVFADKEPCLLLINRAGGIKEVFEGNMIFVGINCGEHVGLNDVQCQRIMALLTPKQRYINGKVDKFVKIILDM
jgi:hypothetical protein